MIKELIRKAGSGRIIALSLFLTMSSVMWGKVEWLQTEYDFGAFPEIAGPRTGTVRFVNKGSEPMLINRVRLTCGCTSESHTEGIVAPGDTAVVNFTYNPIGRPGRFEKSIKVYVGENNDMTVIKMRGTVIGAPQTLDADYPVVAGALRISEREVDFGKVRHSTSRHVFLNLYNQSSDTLRPVWKNTDSCLDIDISSPEILPGDLATMSFYLNTREEERMGPVAYDVEIFPYEGSVESAVVSIVAEITPDTGDLTAEQLKDAPSLEVNPRLLDLGVVNGKKNIKFGFLISNEGKSKLNIRRIYSRTPGVNIFRYPVSLRLGKNGKAEGRLDMSQIPQGAFSVKLEIVSDDPLHPITTLSLSGEKQ